MHRKLKIQFFIFTALFLALPSFAFADTDYVIDVPVFFNNTPEGLASFDSHTATVDAFMAAVQVGDTVIVTGSAANNAAFIVTGVNPGSNLVVFSTTVNVSFDTGHPTFTIVSAPVDGCTDPDATNYDSSATHDDGSCTYAGGGGGGTDFGSLLSAANTGFGTTTGFDVGAAVAWAGDNLIGLFIGSALGVLLGLKYWIAAGLIIAAIIYFSMRGFRFFRN